MVVFKGELIYECLFPCRRLLLEELPAPSGGLQQPSNQAVTDIRSTLSDEDNVIAKRGTQGGGTI